jgi:hypothetical protein
MGGGDTMRYSSSSSSSSVYMYANYMCVYVCDLDRVCVCCVCATGVWY